VVGTAEQQLPPTWQPLEREPELGIGSGGPLASAVAGQLMYTERGMSLVGVEALQRLDEFLPLCRSE
jgi:hypothetical protein